MICINYIDTIKYEASQPYAEFIICDEAKLKEMPIVVFGTGIEAYFAHDYLKKNGIEVQYFVNNDPKMAGRMFCGIPITLPDIVWNKDYYVVVAMSNNRYNNEVLWQLKVHNCFEYALVFCERFHFFETPKIQETVIQSINRILCFGKNMEQIIAPTLNVGPAMGILGHIPELCWTTTWSNHLLEWFCDMYGKECTETIDMLEIGPGMGVFSDVVYRMNNKININWLMFEMKEESNRLVENKYVHYPACNFKTYYGVIEKPDYVIEEKFDVIVLTEVMEHFVTNPAHVIKKIASMLKEGGKIYISTPNWGHLHIYDQYTQIPDYTTAEKYEEMYIGHSYQYSKLELENLFSVCGLRIEKYALSDSNNHNLILGKIKND